LVQESFVRGALAFGGALQVSLINGFTATSGQSFNLFDWDSQSAAFGSLVLPSLAVGLSWNTSQLYTSGVLSVASTGTPGDYNDNSTVDAGYYILWRKYRGTTHVLPKDPTCGTVGAMQYMPWRSHFGQPPGSGSSVGTESAIPEPTSLVLTLIATLFANAFLNARVSISKLAI
jgi:hypothetical protein